MGHLRERGQCRFMIGLHLCLAVQCCCMRSFPERDHHSTHPHGDQHDPGPSISHTPPSLPLAGPAATPSFPARPHVTVCLVLMVGPVRPTPLSRGALGGPLMRTVQALACTSRTSKAYHNDRQWLQHPKSAPATPRKHRASRAQRRALVRLSFSGTSAPRPIRRGCVGSCTHHLPPSAPGPAAKRAPMNPRKHRASGAAARALVCFSGVPVPGCRPRVRHPPNAAAWPPWP